MHFGTVGILGVGLLGGSLGMALRARGLVDRVIGIGRNEERLQLARDLAAIDDYTLDVNEVAPQLDVFVIATPVGLIPTFFQKAAADLKPGAVVTDVGSTKQKVVSECEVCVQRDDVFFVGSHPMAGSEKTGVKSAHADLFDDAVCFVTRTDRSNRKAEDKVCEFWGSVGMKVHVIAPDIHDKMVAATSHLPHLLASALSLFARDRCAENEMIKESIGNGFRDTTRIASGSEDLWKDIFLDNNDNLLEYIEAFCQILQRLAKDIKEDNIDALEQELREGREFRESL